MNARLQPCGATAQTATNKGLKILQFNLQHSSFNFSLLSRYVEENKVDILLLQDPPKRLKLGSNPMRGFSLFLPSAPRGNAHQSFSVSEGPLTAILARSSLYMRQIPYEHNRLCGIWISTPKGPVAVLCAYIHCLQAEGLVALEHLVSETSAQTSMILIGADSNGHSSMWGPPGQISNANGESMEDFIVNHSLVVHNKWPSPPTFVSECGFTSWIDITLSSPRLAPFISSWRVLADAPLQSDHHALSYTLSMTTPRVEQHKLDWRSVSWEDFRSTLWDILQSSLDTSAPLQHPHDIDIFVSTLSEAFQQAIVQHVPIKKNCHLSNPWWSQKLEELRAKHIRLR